MPIIICSHCEYIGQDSGKYLNVDAIWDDVVEHEKTCREKPEDD